MQPKHHTTRILPVKTPDMKANYAEHINSDVLEASLAYDWYIISILIKGKSDPC